mgnify:CR=1 FL=1
MVLKMSDIARMANVSKTAVSLTINGKEGVSEETRQKILNIITEQGYKPLRKNHKGNEKSIGEITFLVVTTSGIVSDNYKSLPFFNSLISALSATVSELNGSLRMVTIQSQDLATKLESMVNKAENGILVLGTDLTKHQVLLIKKHLSNVVFLDTCFENVSADFVTMDNYQGAWLAGEYILKKGYRKIGYFASEKLMSNFKERRRGFRDALAEADVQVNQEQLYYIAPTGLDPQNMDIGRFMQSPPEAVFCEDDYIAIRLIKAAQQHGLKIPEDCAVMGFDDIYEGMLVSPELTTIHVPVEQMASQALHQLLSQIQMVSWNPQKSLITTTLIKRQSL